MNRLYICLVILILVHCSNENNISSINDSNIDTSLSQDIDTLQNDTTSNIDVVEDDTLFKIYTLEKKLDNSAIGEPYYAHFFNENFGYISSMSKLYKTVDGHNFSIDSTYLLQEQSYIEAMHCVDDSTSYILIEEIDSDFFSMYINTTKSWTKKYITISGDSIPLSSKDDYLSKLCFIDKKIGFAYGSICLKTIDGGDNWEVFDVGVNERTKNIFFINDYIGFYSTNEGLFRTEDRGESWKLVYEMQYGNFGSISFINDKIGFIAPGDFKLLKTTDGGETWNNVNIAERGLRYASFLKFIDENRGIGITFSTYTTSQFNTTDVVSIYQTEDGGQTWNNTETFKDNYFYTASFYSKSEGYLFFYDDYFKIAFK